MKLKLCLLALLCLFFQVSAQIKTTVRPLKVGDTIPDLLLNNILNYKGETAKLSDFQNKIILLNFWSTTCGSCIAKFPELIRLQKKYTNNVQFLLVDSKNTRDTRQRVIRFYEAYHPSYKSLPSIVEDTILSQYFPHQTVGYYVWLLNGRVLTMADEEDITDKNINSFLTGHPQVFTKIQDFPYDLGKPIFLNGNGGDAPPYISRTILTSYKSGLHSSARQTFNDKRLCTGYSFINDSKLGLYRWCHPELQGWDENRLIFNVKNPTDFATDSNSENWNSRNLFIYEASFAPMPVSLALKRMRIDLDNAFHLQIDSEMRDTRCYIITLKNPQAKYASQTPLKNESFKEERFLRDFPLSVPVDYLNTKSKIPFVDESDFLGTIRMTYALDDLTVDQIIEKLNINGFEVTPAVRKLKFYVISEKPDFN